MIDVSTLRNLNNVPLSWPARARSLFRPLSRRCIPGTASPPLQPCPGAFTLPLAVSSGPRAPFPTFSGKMNVIRERRERGPILIYYSSGDGRKEARSKNVRVRESRRRSVGGGARKRRRATRTATSRRSGESVYAIGSRSSSLSLFLFSPSFPFFLSFSRHASKVNTGGRGMKISETCLESDLPRIFRAVPPTHEWITDGDIADVDYWWCTYSFYLFPNRKFGISSD